MVLETAFRRILPNGKMLASNFLAIKDSLEAPIYCKEFFLKSALKLKKTIASKSGFVCLKKLSTNISAALSLPEESSM